METIKRKSQKINVFIADEKDINDVGSILPPNFPVITGTTKVTQVVWDKNHKDHVHFRSLSCNICLPDKICSHFNLEGSFADYSNFYQKLAANNNWMDSNETTDSDTNVVEYEVNDYVTVIFDGKWYSGIVEEKKVMF